MAGAVFTPSFRRVAEYGNRLHLVPLIENALRECAFPDEFVVTFKSYAATRKPDGYFHPSNHPTMDNRALYHYMAEPDSWVEEKWESGPRMAVLMGSGMHDVYQTVMTEMGLLRQPTGTCVCCLRPHGTGPGQCNEWGVRDDRLKRRGHLDGFITLPALGDDDGVFDLKTCAPPVIRGVQDNDLETFKAKWPKYFGQQQEYLALSGKRYSIVLFAAMSEGWQFREFVIPRDDAYIARLEAKYQTVLNYVAQGKPPPVPCCSGGAKARKCPATACPIKTGITV